jgi:hypothetical protein
VRHHVHNRPGDCCAAAPRCEEVATEVLDEAPWNGQQFRFAFCRPHADEYAALGYERVGRSEAAGQMALGGAA